MERDQIKKILEGLLFVADRSLDAISLSKLLDTDKKTIQDVLGELKDQIEAEQKAFHVVEVAGGFQMVTRPEYSAWIRKMYQSKMGSRLSKPAFETLAIIAYKQPIIKA